MDAERNLQQQYPWVEWAKPQRLCSLRGEFFGYACKYCTALYGIVGRGCPDKFPHRPELLTHVSKLPKTREAFVKHLREVHQERAA